MATARGKMTQTLNQAILGTYLPSLPAARKAKPTPPQSRLGGARGKPGSVTDVPPADKDSLLHTLARNKAHIPAPLLGIAVWNLLPHYTAPPQPMSDLLRDIFDLDFTSAQRLQRQTLTDAFPPYPNHFILDSEWLPDQRTDAASSATLEICVPRPFDEMGDVVNPVHWAGDAFFWKSLPRLSLPAVGRQQPGAAAPAPRRFDAQLTLPLAAATQPLPVTIEAHISVDPFTTQLDFTMWRNSQIAQCTGSFIVGKEESRPGATRITIQRLLRLRVEDPTQQNAILRYWLHSDAVCLALGARAG